MQFQPSYNLQSLNTLGIAATAEMFCQPDSEADVAEAISYAKGNKLALKVLGGGSNVVMSDQISGLVVQYVKAGYEVLEETEELALLKVHGGQNWHELVLQTLEQGYFGLENLALIPGNMGAAPVQNIGAYGVEVKQFIKTVHGVYLETGEAFSIENADCEFAYRESIFKQRLDGKVLITSVDILLSKTANVQIAYAPLNQMAEEQGEPTPLELARWVIEVRQSKLPDPADLPNAGSFFKNPVVDVELFERLQEQYPNVPSYQQPLGVKVPAGWLIDNLGLKGHKFGPVQVHEKQALVLVNHGGTAEDVASAAKQVCDRVKEHYGIELEQEPRLIR